MTPQEFANKIKNNNFVNMKVSYMGGSPMFKLEITDHYFNEIERETFDDCGDAQKHMIQKAGEYMNRDIAVIINPFTN